MAPTHSVLITVGKTSDFDFPEGVGNEQIVKRDGLTFYRHDCPTEPTGLGLYREPLEIEPEDGCCRYEPGPEIMVFAKYDAEAEGATS